MTNVICNCGYTAQYKGYELFHNYGLPKYVCPVCGKVIPDEDNPEIYDDKEEC